ncbi:putative glycosyltransferase [Pseudohyphozyma bogoriensis]|nr:putative glycosyltransferase [Pseudohyphozyma bogoriensis]
MQGVFVKARRASLQTLKVINRHRGFRTRRVLILCLLVAIGFFLVRLGAPRTPSAPGIPQFQRAWTADELVLKKYSGWGKHTPHASLDSLLAKLDKHPTCTDPTWHAHLVEEWETGRPYRACKKGKWEDSYAQLHAAMLNGTMPPKLVEYRCQRGWQCGGLADRLFGTVSTFMMALVTNRAFFMGWDFPVPPDMVFDSPYIDWSLPFDEQWKGYQNPIYNSTELANGPAAWDFVNCAVDLLEDFEKRTLVTDWDGWNWAQLRTNRGSFYRAFRKPWLEPTLRDMGLDPVTGYGCIIDYLIRPKPDVLEFLTEYTSVLQLPEVYSIAIQIRTGDVSMRTPDADLANTVNRYQHFFRCAQQVGKSYARPDQKIVWLLLTDSAHLRQEALRRYADKVVISGIGATHVADQWKSDGGLQIFADATAFQDSVADGWLMESVDFQLTTMDSGYGALQSFRRGKPGSTITMVKNGDWVPPDCGAPGALTTFDWLADSWSSA